MRQEIDTLSTSGVGMSSQAERARTTFLNWIEAERSRWVLWCPVLSACGIAVYFYLAHEPSLWIGPVTIAVLIFSWLFVPAIRQNSVVFLLIFIPVLVLGFSASQLRTYIVSSPVIEKKTGPVWVVSTVVRWEPKDGGYRATLANLAIDRIAREKTPSRVRITIKGNRQEIRAGDTLRLLAVLYPPAGPVMPGAFDFARQAFFKSLGGVGYAVRKPELLKAYQEAGPATAIARFRQSLTARILSGLPGLSGSFAAALITGERGNIPEDVLSAMRESGLAHLLAISGLQFGLVAGILFFGFRFLLSTIEPLALLYPIKKWAEFCAFIGSFFYLLISGMTLLT